MKIFAALKEFGEDIYSEKDLNREKLASIIFNDKSKLQKLRKLMQTRNIDVCLINQTDEFQNEFLPTYSQRLQWLTNFSGSAGEAIITMSKAYLFVDGRYTLQAKRGSSPPFPSGTTSSQYLAI